MDMAATKESWEGETRRRYYVHMPDGKFGRIDFYLLPYNGVFTVHSAINPTGSPNLETLENKQQVSPPAWVPSGAKAVIPEFK